MGPQDPKDVGRDTAHDLSGLAGELAALKGDAHHWLPSPEYAVLHRLRIELSPMAHRFERNRQLRLQVSSGAHPRYARNTGSGEPLAIATRLVPADKEVFHDPEHPASVILTVLN